MTSLIPNSAVLSPGGGTPQDHLSALWVFFRDSAQHWVVVDVNETGGLVNALLIQQGDQQVLFDVDSGNVRCQLDPNGTRTDVTDPASANSSTLRIGIAAGTYSSNRAVVSELPDAFFWGVYDSTNTFYEQGVHAGVIYVPFDADRLAGHGMLLGNPRITSSSGTGIWLSSQTESRLRLRADAWDRASLVQSTGPNGGLVGSFTMLPPMTIKTGGLPVETDSSVHFGFLRYIRQAFSSKPARTVLPSVTSDQGWLYFGYNTPASSDLIPWDKTVTP